MKFSYLIYVVIDNDNNKCAVTADEPSDCVHVSGVNNRDGKSVSFESEAYHLESWCENEGLELNILNLDAHV